MTSKLTTRKLMARDVTAIRAMIPIVTGFMFIEVYSSLSIII